jgi:hypothetical protein
VSEVLDRPAAPPVPQPQPVPRRRRGSPVTVLYISGYGRSGSTVLGRLLGELPRAAYVGEVNFFWAESVLGDRPCGCGRASADCPLWAKVIDRLGPDLTGRAAAVVAGLRASTRLRHGLSALTGPGRRRVGEAAESVIAPLDELYVAVADESDCDVLVDSSKSPAYLQLLSAAPRVQVETIHLLRDPLAAADSWRRPKREPIGTAELPRFSLAHSALMWNATNLLAGHSRTRQPAHATVRYEDLMRDPNASLDAVGRALGRDLSPIGISDDGRAALGVSHSVAGNPSRFGAGVIQLRPDEAWRGRVTRRDRLAVDLLTYPVRRRYGYGRRG